MGALKSIRGVVKEGHKIFIYVYKTFENAPLRHYLLKAATVLRRYTSKMPADKLYIFLYFILPVILLFFYLPSWISWRIPRCRKYSSMLPYSYEQYGHRSWRDIHMNMFDRFGNPVERRYNRAEMNEWMTETSFQSYELRELAGWVVIAIK